jgi:hypothetical protein
MVHCNSMSARLACHDDSGVKCLVTCGHALETCEPSYIVGSDRVFLSREAGSGAVGHVTASEPSQIERQNPVPRDTW